jgi:hypothetical protein
LPKNFEPLRDCGIEEYSLKYEHDTFKSGEGFPGDRSFMALPSGTTCESVYDPAYDLYYALVKPDGVMEYGLDYAFQFGIMNARTIESLETNVWRFESRMQGVILHLKRNVESFLLQELKMVTVMADDTTANLPLSKVTVMMQSEKGIPGGSVITIEAPKGFIPVCASFRVIA